MVIIWSNFAKNNLRNFVSITLMTKENATNYIKSLIEYVTCLNKYNFLGKVVVNYNNTDIRQLIYKQHRILYCINNTTIYIISVIHTSQNPDKTLESIKIFFDN